jgi:hypothetical protein
MLTGLDDAARRRAEHALGRTAPSTPMPARRVSGSAPPPADHRTPRRPGGAVTRSAAPWI